MPTRPSGDRAVRTIAGSSPDAVPASRAVLRAGYIVALPTDTVYGLAAAVDIVEAVERLYELKGRPRTKAIPILLDDAAAAARVCAAFPPLAEALAEQFWPGPLTIIVPACDELLPLLTDELEDGCRTVALRVPDHPLARRIIAAAGGALAVTSANVSGQPEALDAVTAANIGNEKPELVIDGGRAPGGRPSTIVLATGDHPLLIREGAIPFEAIVTAVAGRGGN